MNFDFPLHFDHRHRTAETDNDDHIRDMIEQVLFTDPGERINRPDFGCGLKQLVFDPNNDELAATVQFLIQSSLQQWLGDLIQVELVKVKSEESKLLIIVQYLIKINQQRKVEPFRRGEL